MGNLGVTMAMHMCVMYFKHKAVDSSAGDVLQLTFCPGFPDLNSSIAQKSFSLSFQTMHLRQPSHCQHAAAYNKTALLSICCSIVRRGQA